MIHWLWQFTSSRQHIVKPLWYPPLASKYSAVVVPEINKKTRIKITSKTTTKQQLFLVLPTTSKNNNNSRWPLGLFGQQSTRQQFSVAARVIRTAVDKFLRTSHNLQDATGQLLFPAEISWTHAYYDKVSGSVKDRKYNMRWETCWADSRSEQKQKTFSKNIIRLTFLSPSFVRTLGTDVRIWRSSSDIW